VENTDRQLLSDNDSWQSFVDASWERAKKQTGFTEEVQCSAVLKARSIRSREISYAIEELVEDAADADSMRGLRWLCLFELNVFSAKQRARLLEVVGAAEPPTAAAIYCLRPDLSDEEDQLLKDAFTPSMAMMRRKILAGTVTRKKIERA